MSKICVKYRLFPSKAQARTLSQTLAVCRDVYNSMTHERTVLYQTQGSAPSMRDQQKAMTQWKKTHSELATVHSQVLQNVAVRVELAFQAFFRRVRQGETPGYPRLKGSGCYDSLTYPQAGYAVGSQTITLSKIGDVKASIHRARPGTIKTCTVSRSRRTICRRFCCDYEPEPLPRSDEAVGIDVGLKTFAALSNGEMIDNPRFFRRDEAALAKAQRKAAKFIKRTKERSRANKVIRRIHERIGNRRHNFVHPATRRLVNRFGIMFVENLNVKGMSRRPKPKAAPNHEGEYLPNGASAKAGLNKSISDAAWSMFLAVLTQKAESAARQVVAVDPRHTTQDCSSCGYRATKKLSERWHHCPMCGLVLDRDTNAAVNIRALGQKSLALARA